MKYFLSLTDLGRFTTADQYNENLNYYIKEINLIVGLEYISDEMNKLYECRSKVLKMDLSHTKENKLLEKIYVAMVRQYKADIRFSETLSKTNELLDEYGVY